MISREEANEYDTVDDAVKAIYDSIGSCGECRYYSKMYTPLNRNKCQLKTAGKSDQGADFFCSDFERKTDD